MKNKIEIKEASVIISDIHRNVILTDTCDNEYRITFLPDGGLNINKLGGINLTDQIMVASRTTNEINIF